MPESQSVRGLVKDGSKVITPLSHADVLFTPNTTNTRPAAAITTKHAMYMKRDQMSKLAVHTKLAKKNLPQKTSF